MNALDPNRMTAEERLDEAAEILAVGILRWQKKQDKKTEKTEKFPLDKSDDQCPYGRKTTRGEMA